MTSVRNKELEESETYGNPRVQSYVLRLLESHHAVYALRLVVLLAKLSLNVDFYLRKILADDLHRPDRGFQVLW